MYNAPATGAFKNYMALITLVSTLKSAKATLVRFNCD